MAAVEEFELTSGSASGDAGSGPAWRRPLESGAAAWVAAAIALVVVGAATASPTLPDPRPRRRAVVRPRRPGSGAACARSSGRATSGTPPWSTSGAIVRCSGRRTTARAPPSSEWTSRTASRCGTTTTATPRVSSDPGCCASSTWATPTPSIVSIELDDGSQTSWPYPGALAAIPVGEGVAVIVKTSTDTERVVLLDADGSERWRADLDAADTDAQPVWVFAEEVGGEALVPARHAGAGRSGHRQRDPGAADLVRLRRRHARRRHREHSHHPDLRRGRRRRPR